MSSSRHRLSTVSILCVAAIAVAARTADAQTFTSWTATQEGPAITAVLGRTSNTIAGPENSAFDLATRFDTPISDRHLIRLEAGKAAWGVRQRDSFDRLSITRATVSIVWRAPEPPMGILLRFYAGGGFGRYHFSSRQGGVSSRGWRRGIHVLGGFEFPFPDSRLVLAAELQLHAADVPAHWGPWSSLGSAAASVGLKIRM